MLLEGASILAPLLDEDELQAKLCPHVLEMCDDKVPNLRIDAVKCCKNVGQRVGDDWREKLLGKLREKVAPACNHMRPACNAVRPGLLATPCTEALGHPCCDGVHPPVTRLHPPCTPIRLGDGRRPGRQVLLQRFHRRHHRLIVVGLDGRRGREGGYCRVRCARGTAPGGWWIGCAQDRCKLDDARIPYICASGAFMRF